MNGEERQEIIRRLEARFASSRGDGDGRIPADMSSGDGASGRVTVQAALDRMVDAGASRFGVSADSAGTGGFSACELAPPLARMIDHTALKPDTTESMIGTLCDEAARFCFASVCVNPTWVSWAADRLRSTPVAICTVIGFPLGSTLPDVKAREAELVVRDGATEVDMVINVGRLKSGHYEYVEEDIRAVVDAARAAAPLRAGRSRDIVTKVILETALLTDEEKVIGSVLARNAGADFVKTSTGFSKGGATASDVSLMRRAVGPGMGVKASGGVRTREDAERMIAHGATRIGASASVAIMQGLDSDSDY
jgi:deoxyribose-phosphate aldolase